MTRQHGRGAGRSLRPFCIYRMVSCQGSNRLCERRARNSCQIGEYACDSCGDGRAIRKIVGVRSARFYWNVGKSVDAGRRKGRLETDEFAGELQSARYSVHWLYYQ